jgi:tRNA threonylcarbamoyladenosine biosynthesis protein TsaE
MIEIISNSPDETIALGKKTAGRLCTGSIIAIKGTLGSGKTCFSKGIALGLGIEENITSPTYTIINEYKRDGCPTLYHIDAYRLNCDKDFEDIGGIDVLNSGGISIIEWSERLPNSIPKEAIFITIEIKDEISRTIKIKGLDL